MPNNDEYCFVGNGIEKVGGAVAVTEKVKTVVEIFHEDYTIKGEATPDHMNMLAAYVDGKMKQIAARQPMLTVTKLAVLTALNIADELSRLQQDYDILISLMDEENKKPGSIKQKPDRMEKTL